MAGKGKGVPSFALTTSTLSTATDLLAFCLADICGERTRWNLGDWRGLCGVTVQTAGAGLKGEPIRSRDSRRCWVWWVVGWVLGWIEFGLFLNCDGALWLSALCLSSWLLIPVLLFLRGRVLFVGFRETRDSSGNSNCFSYSVALLGVFGGRVVWLISHASDVGSDFDCRLEACRLSFVSWVWWLLGGIPIGRTTMFGLERSMGRVTTLVVSRVESMLSSRVPLGSVLELAWIICFWRMERWLVGEVITNEFIGALGLETITGRVTSRAESTLPSRTPDGTGLEASRLIFLRKARWLVGGIITGISTTFCDSWPSGRPSLCTLLQQSSLVIICSLRSLHRFCFSRVCLTRTLSSFTSSLHSITTSTIISPFSDSFLGCSNFCVGSVSISYSSTSKTRRECGDKGVRHSKKRESSLPELESRSEENEPDGIHSEVGLPILPWLLGRLPRPHGLKGCSLGEKMSSPSLWEPPLIFSMLARSSLESKSGWFYVVRSLKFIVQFMNILSHLRSVDVLKPYKSIIWCRLHPKSGETNREISRQHESPLKLYFVTQTWGWRGQLSHDKECCGNEVVMINLSWKFYSLTFTNI